MFYFKNFVKYSAKKKLIKAYISLTKPRIVILVCFTALCGISLASEWSFKSILLSMFSIAVGAGGSACVNMWYDRDIDKLMLRTKNRPLVTGIIEPSKALLIGLILNFLSVFISLIYFNILSSIFLLSSIVYYSVIYTVFLKRKSIYNVVLGAVPGALPPVIGFTSVTGRVGTESLILFLIIFFWSAPHSWALAIFRIKDFRRAGIPMITDKGLNYSIKQIVLYSILTIICSYLPYLYEFGGKIYLTFVTMLNVIFVYYLYKLSNGKKDYIKNSRSLFLFSTIYLFFLFFIIFLENVFIL